MSFSSREFRVALCKIIKQNKIKKGTGFEVLGSNVSLPYFKLTINHYPAVMRKVHKLSIGFDKIKETEKNICDHLVQSAEIKRDRRYNYSTSPITY